MPTQESYMYLKYDTRLGCIFYNNANEAMWKHTEDAYLRNTNIGNMEVSMVDCKQMFSSPPWPTVCTQLKFRGSPDKLFICRISPGLFLYYSSDYFATRTFRNCFYKSNSSSKVLVWGCLLWNEQVKNKNTRSKKKNTEVKWIKPNNFRMWWSSNSPSGHSVNVTIYM